MPVAVRIATLIGLSFACVVAGAAATAGPLPEVDLQLILAVDVSRSMDVDEHRLQREGYVAAFRHPDILRAIESGPLGRIAVVYFEWAGPRHQSVAVPWTVLDDRDDARAFADKLAAQPILPEAGTSISGSLLFAERIFSVSGTSGLRRVIDVSGDGPNNMGPAIGPVRDRLVAEGVTVNGLPIELGTSGRGEVAEYYERYVIGGPGAFTISIDGKSRFADAIRRKLVLEIAWLPTDGRPGDLGVVRGKCLPRCARSMFAHGAFETQPHSAVRSAVDLKRTPKPPFVASGHRSPVARRLGDHADIHT